MSEDFFLTLVTGVDAIICDEDLYYLRDMIVQESNNYCGYNNYIIDCDCSKGIDSVFKPLVFTTTGINEETIDLVI